MAVDLETRVRILEQKLGLYWNAAKEQYENAEPAAQCYLGSADMKTPCSRIGKDGKVESTTLGESRKS